MLFNFNLIILLLITNFSSNELPDGFEVLSNKIPDLIIDQHYATSDNFMGRPVVGYSGSKTVGSVSLANALLEAQQSLKKRGLGLKIFDAYRPQSAINDFIKWAKIPSDTITKKKYYPCIEKDRLFKLGYIAKRSGHSRGSTVDLTLLYLTGTNEGKELDMGGTWDFFGIRSHYNFKEISLNQTNNRKLLRKIMQKASFVPYDKEWWHFTLKDEPFPNTYFDFIP